MDAVPLNERIDQLEWYVAGAAVRWRNGALIIPALRSALHEVDPTVPFIAPRTMTDVISETLVFVRMESWLFGVFAGLALVACHGRSLRPRQS